MRICTGHSMEFDFKKFLYLPIKKSRLSIEHDIVFYHEQSLDFVTKDMIKI